MDDEGDGDPFPFFPVPTVEEEGPGVSAVAAGASGSHDSAGASAPAPTLSREYPWRSQVSDAELTVCMKVGGRCYGGAAVGDRRVCTPFTPRHPWPQHIYDAAMG